MIVKELRAKSKALSSIMIVLFVIGWTGFVNLQDAAAQDGDYPYAGWMGAYRDALNDKPLNEVTLLGSHDAATADLHKKSDVCIGYQMNDNRRLRSHPSSKDIKKFKCQNASIREQLLAGVRYLDLRVAYQDGKYWSHHGFLSTPFTGSKGILTQIREFLKDYPDEIMILNMSHFFYEEHKMSFEEVMAFYEVVKGELPGLLIPAGKPTVKVKEIWSRKGRIVLVMSVDLPVPAPATAEFIWNHKLLHAHWWKQKNLDKLMDKLDGQVRDWKGGKEHGKFKELQAIKSSNKKIGDAGDTNGRVRDKLASDWKGAPISIIMVNDTVNSGIMPLLVENNTKQMHTKTDKLL